MKRLSDTCKWEDKWFRALSPNSKLLWLWLLDHCDNAGVIDPDLSLAAFQTGCAINEKHLTELGDRVQSLPNGKLIIPKFIRFQFGKLTAESRVHASVLKLVAFHGLQYPMDSLSLPYVNPNDRVAATPKYKDNEKEPDKDNKDGDARGRIYSPESRVALHYLNEKSGRQFRECESSLAPINARLLEPGVDIAGVKKMIDRQVIRWKGDAKMEEYLRPQTLFGKEKFDGYYAAKDLPAGNSKPQAESKQLHETINIPRL